MNISASFNQHVLISYHPMVLVTQLYEVYLWLSEQYNLQFV